MAMCISYFSGFPETTSLSSVNRQCSSGLQAVMNIAASIRMGTIDVGIGAGYAKQLYDDVPQFILFCNRIATSCIALH